MKSVGIDLHKKSITVCVVDQDRTVLLTRRFLCCEPERIVAFFAGTSDESRGVRAFPDLTPREREVLELLATGCRNHDIARRLTMSEKTVRNHVSQVLMKLHVPDRTAAALRAREAGLGTPPTS